jgi:glycosyltransferase involved in cell wall biosynthesis
LSAPRPAPAFTVDVSVCGAFHAYSLANELYRRDHLGTLFTSYPGFYLPRRFRTEFPPARVRANWLQLGVEAALRLAPRDPEAGWWMRQAHDAWVARGLREGADLFVGWSGCSLRAVRRARALGKTTLLVRGSAHIAEQMALLAREHDRLGLPFQAPRRTVELELEEYGEVDLIQTNSSFAADSFIARGFDPARVIMVNTGVDLARFRPVAREGSRATFRVITCGSLGVRKGIHILLEAFARAALPDAELVLIGPVLPELAPLVARHASATVRAVGPVPNAELHRWFSQGDVFVMPSIEEGLAAVQAQAMACGLPLVSSRASGGADLLSADGVEGFLAAPGDVEALTERLVWCHANREALRAMGDAALARARDALTWEAYGERITARYRDLVAARRGAGQGVIPPA